MKRICITYHMSNEIENAENCVILSMTDEIADDLLTTGAKSLHLNVAYVGEVYRLRHLRESIYTMNQEVCLNRRRRSGGRQCGLGRMRNSGCVLDIWKDMRGKTAGSYL